MIPSAPAAALLALNIGSASAAIVGVTSDIEGVTTACVATWERGAAIVHEANTVHKPKKPLRFSVDAQTQWSWEAAPNDPNRSLMEVTMDIVDEVVLMDYGGGAIYNWLARAWPWFARSRVLAGRPPTEPGLGNRNRTVLVSMGMEAGPRNIGLNTELLVEKYLNDTAYSALMGYRTDGPTRYYDCANLFNGYCPFHRFAIFLYENYLPITETAPCPAGACPSHRQPRALWFYQTAKLLYNATARSEFISWCSIRNVDELYMTAEGLPGCSAGNTTTLAAFKGLVAELHAHMIDVQVMVGDELGTGCPVENTTDPGGCDIYPCIRAAVNLAVKLDKVEQQQHKEEDPEDEQQRKPPESVPERHPHE